MCLIHVKPAHARSPSPDPIVPSRPITRGTPIVPTPPLSPQSYTRTRPHSQSARLSTTGTYTRSPRASNPQTQSYTPRTSDLRRLSIQSSEQWEATRRKEAEREETQRRKRDEELERERGYEMHQLDPPSTRRISFHDPPEKVVVFSDHERKGTRLPILRNGSNYSYGEGPVRSSASSLNGTMAPPPPPQPLATNKSIINAPLPTTKPSHRRRESSVSILNGKDGSVLERNPSGQLQPSSQRPSGAPRRSTGNVSVDWGKDPRASRGSVGGRERERIVVVDEVRGVRRRESLITQAAPTTKDNTSHTARRWLAASIANFRHTNIGQGKGRPP
ncbi:inositol-1,4,5-trisphosphate 5-phosphatase 1 [Physcia stellaris]|nr:inositol-1,4,5-trisphosphate 5-phosphatase 1 [Physcia stellaris]